MTFNELCQVRELDFNDDAIVHDLVVYESMKPRDDALRSATCWDDVANLIDNEEAQGQ